MMATTAKTQSVVTEEKKATTTKATTATKRTTTVTTTKVTTTPAWESRRRRQQRRPRRSRSLAAYGEDSIRVVATTRREIRGAGVRYGAYKPCGPRTVTRESEGTRAQAARRGHHAKVSPASAPRRRCYEPRRRFIASSIQRRRRSEPTGRSSFRPPTFRHSRKPRHRRGHPQRGAIRHLRPKFEGHLE